MMDHQALNSAIDQLVLSFAARTPHKSWTNVLDLSYHGEEEEAVDVLIATLVHDAVPVSSGERDRVHELMQQFRFTPEEARYYRYLAVPEMLDRLNVVDGTPS